MHDLEAEPHQSISLTGAPELQNLLETAEFIRLGKIIRLDQWEVMREELYKGFTELLLTIRVQ